MIVKFHKITSYTWNFQNFTCTIIIFVKYSLNYSDIRFSSTENLKLLNVLMDSVLIKGPFKVDRVFRGQYLPSLSVNYVVIDRDLEKLPPQLY